MNDQAEALILEDDPGELEELAQVMAECGFQALKYRSPSDALRAIAFDNLTQRFYHEPILAIIDLNMEKAPDRSRRSEEVLKALFDSHPSCTVLVHSANANTVETRERLQDAHPRYLLHDKGGANDRLKKRVRDLLTSRVGDLILEGGRVTHVPSKKTATAKVAVELMVNYNADKRGIRANSVGKSRALRRFKSWLAATGSPVRVEKLSNSYFSLMLPPAPE